jgi:hypothetical protein
MERALQKPFVDMKKPKPNAQLEGGEEIERPRSANVAGNTVERPAKKQDFIEIAIPGQRKEREWANYPNQVIADLLF